MRKLFIILALVTISLATTACNTVQGIGEDITAAGRWGQGKMSGE